MYRSQSSRHMINFSLLQVRESWAIVEPHSTSLGIQLFMHFFGQNPSTVQLFSFKGKRISLSASCACFACLNPLPQNLRTFQQQHASRCVWVKTRLLQSESMCTFHARCTSWTCTFMTFCRMHTSRSCACHAFVHIHRKPKKVPISVTNRYQQEHEISWLHQNITQFFKNE